MIKRISLMLAVAMLCNKIFANKDFYVDLSPVANISREDDGIAKNGKGGWTDEGINDMFLYPPLPVGETTRNGHKFYLLDPGEDGMKPAALMLRVGAHQKNLPKSARVDVPDVKGKFVVFIQNSIGGSMAKAGDTIATYTIHYSDGKTVDAAMKKGVHLRDWWCRQWWDNSGRNAWPVHMGRNIYTMKWRSLIGMWATQWENPNPESAINGITFTSHDAGGPVIWAVTITDDDPHKDEARLKGDTWQSPPEPPRGYFARKQAMENAAIYNEALANDHVKGLRTVELIRNDILAVTVDPGLTRSVITGDFPDNMTLKPDLFLITSSNDPAYSEKTYPVKIGRNSYEYWNGDIGAFRQNSIYWHTFYLFLPKPLKDGCSYEVKIPSIDDSLRSAMVLAYKHKETQTPVIKVNQVGYSSQASRRYAYVGWWAGDMGAVDFNDLSSFEVVDETSGSVVLSGELANRADPAGNTGEAVLEMDISSLGRGRYHIRLPNLGRSAPFEVGGTTMRELYVNTQRAFYHQRCGFPLEQPYTEFLKPACHLWVYESGMMVDDPSYKPLPGEKKREYRGGYHDAADFDCFTYHLRATALNLDAFEMSPGAFLDGDLNIPESGNGIPDILDEAEWALRFWREQQAKNGAIPKGRCNDQDSRRQNHVKWGPFGIFQPDAESNYEYAAVAASFARTYKKYDEGLASKYLDSAILAYDWADKQPSGTEDESRDAFALWAAASIYRATGSDRFNNDVIKIVDRNPKPHWKLTHWIPMMRWQYVRSNHPNVDTDIQEKFKKDIISSADAQLDKRLDTDAYRWGGDSTRGMGWGNANGGGYHADILLRAWWLAGDKKYIDGASLNADFQLGCNPLSKTFITGMGTRYPLHPQISAFLYEEPGKRGKTVKGITIFGLTDRDPKGWYPEDRPRLRRWRDLGNGSAEISSEFTITETIGSSAMLYAALYALEAENDKR